MLCSSYPAHQIDSGTFLWTCFKSSRYRHGHSLTGNTVQLYGQGLRTRTHALVQLAHQESKLLVCECNSTPEVDFFKGEYDKVILLLSC